MRRGAAARGRATGAGVAAEARNACTTISGEDVRSVARLLLGTFVRGTGARRPDEQFLAVGERDVTAVGAERAVLGLKAFDDDLGARRQRLLGPAAPQQCVRRAAFDHPLL